MGTINHEAVLATVFNEDVDTVKEWVANRTEDEQSLFSYTKGWVNGYTTILLAPCGSKKGWTSDEIATQLREDFIDYINRASNVHSRWVEVSWGECGQRVVQGNNRNYYGEPEDNYGTIWKNEENE